MKNNKMRHLPVRSCSIFCKEHPEWGTWGVMEEYPDYYEIVGNSGSRVLFKSEAVRFWDVVSAGCLAKATGGQQ